MHDEVIIDIENPKDNDAISRSGAVKAIEERAKRIKNEDTLNGLAGAVGILFELPPVTQKSGKWIHFAQSDDCSLCGYSTGKYGSPSKFCPNCGARMESEEQG